MDETTEGRVLNKAQKLLLHPQLKFVIAKWVDPKSRFYARIALRHKLGWIPKELLAYLKEKREKGESLKWDGKNLKKVVKEDNFEVVKWAGTFNEYVKKDLCGWAASYGKLHMLKWARKQQPPLPWNRGTCFHAFDNGHCDTLKWLLENGCPLGEWFDDDDKTDFLQYASIFEDEKKWKNIE